ncbi:MAG: tetratricopeptide repeat protein, partial [Burkholderiales bacterium]|nr:tetratricopeptide repeat protein [Burkholderiales bacterium]
SYVTVFNYVNLAELYFEQARLDQAMSAYEQAFQLTERHTGRRDMPFSGFCYVGIGRILRQRNDLENAYKHT